MCAVASASSACGATPTRSAPPPPAPVAEVISVAGTWSWTYESHVDGVRRVEREIWTLSEAAPAALEGEYWRRVTFESTAGVAFTCSQSRSFAIESRVALSGERSSTGAILRERAVLQVASPCLPATPPPLETHQLTRDGDRIRVATAAALQTLERGREAAPPPRAATIAGDWRWETTSTSDIEETGLVESWRLRLNGAEITGRYERTVTVRRIDGAPLACAGNPSASWTDAYTLSGGVRDGDVEIVEQAVTLGASPCQPAGDRHLDSARGKLYRDHIELSWRGDRRQVLGRTRAEQGHPEPDRSPSGSM